jgi:hypothetical protein
MYSCECDTHKGKIVSKTAFYRCSKKRKALEDRVPPSDQDSDADSEPNEENPEIDCENARSFACHMVEQVVRGRVTSKGVTDILKIFQRHYGNLLPRHTKMPASWYMVRKLACKEGGDPQCDIRDVCPLCDWIFPRTADPLCGRCGKNTRWHERKVGEPVRQAAYFDIEHDMRKFFEVEEMADALEEFATQEPAAGPIRDRQLDAAVDGSIVHDLHVHQSADHACTSSDEEATEVEDLDEPALEASASDSGYGSEAGHHERSSSDNSSEGEVCQCQCILM